MHLQNDVKMMNIQNMKMLYRNITHPYMCSTRTYMCIEGCYTSNSQQNEQLKCIDNHKHDAMNMYKNTRNNIHDHKERYTYITDRHNNTYQKLDKHNREHLV